MTATELVWQTTVNDVMVPGSQGAWLIIALFVVFWFAVPFAPGRGRR